MLKLLLLEADSMPVTMDETSVLRSHLNALEWAKKVKPFMDDNNNNNNKNKDNNNNKDKENNNKEKKKNLPKLSDMQALQKEITK